MRSLARIVAHRSARSRAPRQYVSLAAPPIRMSFYFTFLWLHLQSSQSRRPRQDSFVLISHLDEFLILSCICPVSAKEFRKFPLISKRATDGNGVVFTFATGGAVISPGKHLLARSAAFLLHLSLASSLAYIWSQRHRSQWRYHTATIHTNIEIRCRKH